MELRVEAMRDVRAVARVAVGDPAAADDLRALVASALGAAREKALRLGELGKAEVLERVAVLPGRDDFTLSLDLPADVLERLSQRCRREAEGESR